MIDQIPTLIEQDLVRIFKHMSDDDVKKVKEYCMIHFSRWLFTIITNEARIANITYEEFVRQACVNEIKRRVSLRLENEKSRDESISAPHINRT